MDVPTVQPSSLFLSPDESRKVLNSNEEMIKITILK
jgi:hypothetical protein